MLFAAFVAWFGAEAVPAALDPAQAFRGDLLRGPVLDRDAITVHAMVEYVFAPARNAPKEAAASVEEQAVAPSTAPNVAPSAASTLSAPSLGPVPPSVPSFIERGHQALSRMPVQPASVGFTIEFHPARSGYGGLTYPDARRIEVYVDSGWSDAHLAHVVAHEIGHAVDMARNNRADHERWRDARGIPQTTKWWADPYTSDFASPGGDFAECFALWALGTTSTRSAWGSCAGTGPLVAELVRG